MTEIPPPQPPIWDHGQRRMALVQSVLTEVLNGHWKPGQHLVGQELADRYGVSQTPIREALITLAGIGVVDLLPNRGAVVRQVTVQEVREVCQVRRVLECEAVRSACGRIDSVALDAAITEAKAIAKAAPSAEIIKRAQAADDAFHDLISRSCGNGLLGREIDRLKMLFRAYRDAGWAKVAAAKDFSRIAPEASEHLAILEALAANDVGAAARAMAFHIRSGEKVVLSLMKTATRKKGQS
jgi:DNA-binding GntR family transcriptional regulator